MPAVFKEIHRILKKNKHVIFTAPTDSFRDGLFYYPLAKKLSKKGKYEKTRMLLQYDRGRSGWEPRPRKYWEEFFEISNLFKIVNYSPFLDNRLLKFWDVGFRPFFPKLIMLKEAVQKEEYLLEFKALVVEIMKNYFFNLIRRPINENCTFAVIVAKKC